MRSFRPRREYQAAYILIGLVFLGVSFPLWAEWNALPDGDSWSFLYFSRNATVAVLGVLLVLRPWRSKLGIDGECIRYADGFMPARRIPLAAVDAVFSNKGRRMILYLQSGRKIYIEHTFEGLEEFLALLAQSGIPALDGPRGRRPLR